MSDTISSQGTVGSWTPPPPYQVAPDYAYTVSEDRNLDPKGTQAEPDPKLAFECLMMAVERMAQMLAHAIAVVPALGGLAPAASALSQNVVAARTAFTPPTIFPEKPSPVADAEAEIAAARAKFEKDAADRLGAARIEQQKADAAEAEKAAAETPPPPVEGEQPAA